MPLNTKVESNCHVCGPLKHANKYIEEQHRREEMGNMMIDIVAQQGNFLTSPTINRNDYVFRKSCKLCKSL